LKRNAWPLRISSKDSELYLAIANPPAIIPIIMETWFNLKIYEA